MQQLNSICSRMLSRAWPSGLGLKLLRSQFRNFLNFINFQEFAHMKFCFDFNRARIVMMETI